MNNEKAAFVHTKKAGLKKKLKKRREAKKCAFERKKGNAKKKYRPNKIRAKREQTLALKPNKSSV